MDQTQHGQVNHESKDDIGKSFIWKILVMYFLHKPPILPTKFHCGQTVMR